MLIHLIDGTYELFRHYYALPKTKDKDGREVAAVRGVVNSVLGMISAGATHVAVATDQVIESFRNRLWPGYKTGDGIEPDLCGRSFRCSKKRWRRPGFKSGRWWSLRPTTRWRPARSRPPFRRRSNWPAPIYRGRAGKTQRMIFLL